MNGMSPDVASFVADKTDIQGAIYFNALNESGFVYNTIEAISGRAIILIIPKKLSGHALGVIKIACKRYTSFFHTSPPRPFTVNKFWRAP